MKPNKEEIYDAHIAPLMTQIIAICQENKIAMLATFNIPHDDDPDLACTTHLPDETGTLPEPIRSAVRVIRPSPMMLTVRGADGEVKSMTAVHP